MSTQANFTFRHNVLIRSLYWVLLRNPKLLREWNDMLDGVSTFLADVMSEHTSPMYKYESMRYHLLGRHSRCPRWLAYGVMGVPERFMGRVYELCVNYTLVPTDGIRGAVIPDELHYSYMYQNHYCLCHGGSRIPHIFDRDVQMYLNHRLRERLNRYVAPISPRTDLEYRELMLSTLEGDDALSYMGYDAYDAFLDN